MADHLSPRLLDFIERSLPSPPARVLEIGCGDGSLTRRLRDSGHEAIGVDPDAPHAPGFLRRPVEELWCDEPFEAAVAIRPLHHVGEIDAAVAALARCLKSRGRLVVFEFAVENVTRASERWLGERELPPPIDPAHRNEIVAFAEVDAALSMSFARILGEPAPYLAREADRPELEADEAAAIDAGRLPAAGMRAVYELREPRAPAGSS